MRGSLFIAAAASLWGLWSLFFKNAERLAGPAPLGAQVEGLIILVVMALALLPKALLDWRRAQARSGSEWARLCLIGLCDGLNLQSFLVAMQKTTVAVAVLTHYLAPLLVAVLAPLLLGERWRARTLGALGVGLGGLVLLLQPWSSTWEGAHAADHALGALLGAVSAFFYAASVLLQKRLVLRFSPFELGAFSKPASVAVMLMALPSLGALEVGMGATALLVAGGLLCGALPCVLFFVGLPHTSASRASVLTLCEPLVAVLVGALCWREPLGAPGVAGALLILGAAAALARAGGQDEGA